MSFTLFNQLVVVQKAHQMVLDVYKVTADYPAREQYGLVSQLRRAAASVPTNICEGKGRESDNELARFLLISRGSLREMQYLLMLSNDLEYLKDDECKALQKQAVEVDRMIGGMLSSIKAHPVVLWSRRRKKVPSVGREL